MGQKPRQAQAALGFVRLSRGFWSSSARGTAWRLSAAVAVLLLGNLAVNLWINRWNRWFFDTLESRETGLLVPLIGIFLVLILLGAAFAVAMVHCRMSLQLEWRQWLTIFILQRWAARGDAASIPFPLKGSPEFRVVEDIRLAIDPAVEMTIGLLNASILGATFIGVLVIVGGGQHVDLGFAQFEIPGIFAVAAIAYSAAVSALMSRIGRPLIRAVAEKNEAEGRFLFELTGAAEGPREPATTSSSPEGFAKAQSAFGEVRQRWNSVIRATRRLTWLSNSNAFFGPALPLLIAMPKYLAGELSLGAVMQLVTAFTIVLGALNWFTDNYVRFAEWAASARRVEELYRAVSSASDDKAA